MAKERKFLACVCGLDSASSKFCLKDEHHIDRKLFITDTRRSTDYWRYKGSSKAFKKSSKRYNCSPATIQYDLHAQSDNWQCTPFSMYQWFIDKSPIWNEFHSYHPTPSLQRKSQYSNRVKSWRLKFLEVYQSKNVTPYMHVFIAYVPEFLRIDGAIVPYTQGKVGEIEWFADSILFCG